MSTSAVSKQCLANVFWCFSERTYAQKESERLQQIKVGASVDLVDAIRVTFNLSASHLAMLFNASLSTLRRLKQQQKGLSSIASERLDRIAIVSQQIQEVFEDQVATTHWMSVPNQSLGNAIPLMLCSTELGAKQIRRVLHALEWGGAA